MEPWTGALAQLGVARANALQVKTSQGADADAAVQLAITFLLPVRSRVHRTESRSDQRLVRYPLAACAFTRTLVGMKPFAHASESTQTRTCEVCGQPGTLRGQNLGRPDCVCAANVTDSHRYIQ
jgi:hypothetical protein